ncbi:MAG: HAAS signaling domain-containing protein [Mycoplasmatales bacterium]
MQKDNFLEQLRYELYFFKGIELEQIIEDYDSLIEEKLADNILIDEVIKSLDSPELIAKNYADELNIKISSMDKVFVNGKKEIKNNLENLRKKTYKKSKKESTKQNDFYQDFKKVIMFFIVVIIKFIIFVFKFFVCILYLLLLSIVIILFMLLIIFTNFGEYHVSIISLSSIGVISYIVFSSFITMKVMQIKVKIGNTRWTNNLKKV